MASRLAHAAMAWPSGIIAAALAWSVLPSDIARLWWCAGAFLMALPGSGAPDWMELEPIRRGRGRHSWIAHRTWTHWVPAWIALAGYAWWSMTASPAWSLAFGFATGALIHLFADAPTARGLPWIFPTRRITFNLWNSGTGDAFLVFLTWMGAWLAADTAWLGGAVLSWASAQWSACLDSESVQRIVGQAGYLLRPT